MFTLIAENKYGQTLNLTHNQAYDISSIDGLAPIDATINTTKNAGQDGSVFNSSYNNERQIILTVAINNPAEMNRLNLYKYFRTKEKVRLYYTNDSLNVYIDGYVSEVSVDYFANKQIAQITILCPEPFWNDVYTSVQTIDPSVPLFEFPFSIEEDDPIPFSELDYTGETRVYNDGNVECGCRIRVIPQGNITKFTITNSNTGEVFKYTGSVTAGTPVEIDTRVGHKDVRIYTTKKIQYVAAGSTWFQLRPGVNPFYVTTGTGEASCEMIFTVVNQYQGV